MCGIAGVIEFANPSDLSPSSLERMAGVLRHRGPDDQGFYVSGGTALVHRRLSIIDLSAGGHQPKESEDGAHTVVFNGEIYNFPELRADLEARGESFTTRSDTEVLLRAYRVWGVDCLSRLNGMFAFAIWDSRRRVLFAARDRLGKKPFFYYEDGRRLVFGSEIKAILAYGNVDREIDVGAVDQYLTDHVIPAPRTVFRKVRKLLPGHYLLFENGQSETRPYWTFEFQPDPVDRGEDAYVEELEHLLRGAVRRRLLSDVPVGAFLSGGLDSSVVVAMMAQLSDQPVKTYTVGFSERGYSEVEDARIIARHFGTEHHEMIVEPSAISILPDLVWHYDEPFGDSSAVPTYYVSRMAASHVKVALSGDGGDEVFAGYTRYRAAERNPFWSWIPERIRSRALGPLVGTIPIDWPGRNRLYEMAHASGIAPGYGLGLYPYIKERLYTPSMRAAAAANPSSRETYATLLKGSDWDPVTRLQYLDTVRYLPDDILTKVDRASMAHSLETRAPLLDYTLVEFLARVPSRHKLRDGVQKILLRRLAAKLLPQSALQKPKQGFGIPQGIWFRRDLEDHARKRLLEPRTLDRGYFDRVVLERVLDSHRAGRRDYSDWIWCLLMLEEWHRVFVDPDTRRI
jgi:asparagine synthase (glutamine-hydrolysing)